MKIEEIIAKWKVDSAIDATDLTAEGQKIYSLHSTYLDMWSQETMRLKSLEMAEKVLKLEKFEFLSHGASKESKEKGWQYPTSGRILNTNIDLYRDADKQVQELVSKIIVQKNKVDTLKWILDAINQRTYVINGLIKREIFMGGM